VLEAGAHPCRIVLRHKKTVSTSEEIETVGLFEGDEEASGSFEGRGTGALPDVLRTSGPIFGSGDFEKNRKKFIQPRHPQCGAFRRSAPGKGRFRS
jgi:hypothetical protein